MANLVFNWIHLRPEMPDSDLIKKEPPAPGVGARPSHSPIVHLKLVATLLGTLLHALLINVTILSKKCTSAFLTALPRNVCSVSDVCTRIDKVSMKASLRRPKKLTSMVRSTDCRFFSLMFQPSRPISSQRSEPCFQPG